MKANTLHIYRAVAQPATRYRVGLGDETVWLENPKNRAIRAACCGFRRCARNLSVQVYYDKHRFVCVAGKGCKEL